MVVLVSIHISRFYCSPDCDLIFCLFINTIKMNEEDVEKVELLLDYTKFLLKQGYVDDDVWCEEPAAIDRYLQSKEEEEK